MRARPIVAALAGRGHHVHGHGYRDDFYSSPRVELNMRRLALAALVSGALFGIGLAMSGMTDPRRVLGFLDLFGDFDPTLLFVLGGAVVTTTVLFRFVLRRGRPVL